MIQATYDRKPPPGINNIRPIVHARNQNSGETNFPEGPKFQTPKRKLLGGFRRKRNLNSGRGSPHPKITRTPWDSDNSVVQKLTIFGENGDILTKNGLCLLELDKNADTKGKVTKILGEPKFRLHINIMQ